MENYSRRWNSGEQRRKEPKPGDVAQVTRPISQKMILQLKHLKFKKSYLCTTFIWFFPQWKYV